MNYTERSSKGKPLKAENDLFSWNFLQPGFLVEKATNRAIYQMSYMRTESFGSDPITDDGTKQAVRDFLDALRAEEQRAEAEYAQQQRSVRAAQATNNDPRKARIYDDLQNEGYSDGYNPYRS